MSNSEFQLIAQNTMNRKCLKPELKMLFTYMYLGELGAQIQRDYFHYKYKNGLIIW